MEDLTQTLFDLLYHRETRQRFQSMSLSERAESGFGDFETVDWKQFDLFAETIERKTFESPLVAGKSLENAFAETISRIKTIDAGYRSEFLHSAAFSLYSDLNHSADFLSLEEAFYRFASENFPKVQGIARHEYLIAHLQNLAMHSEPAFQIRRDLIQKLRNGHVAIQVFDSKIWLYASIEQTFISGPIDESIADVIERHFVGGLELIDEAQRETAEGLRALGF